MVTHLCLKMCFAIYLCVLEEGIMWRCMYTDPVSLSQATQLQTRYMELLTLSGDYYTFLGELLKNMEELKVPVYCVHCA